MKTFPKTLTMDTRFAQPYGPLVRNLGFVIVITFVLTGITLKYFDSSLVNSLSQQLIEKSVRETGERLDRKFGRASRRLHNAQDQLEALEIAIVAGRESLFNALAPYLTNYDVLDSINLADASGSEFVLIDNKSADEEGREILIRFVDGGEPEIAHWRRRHDSKLIEEWTRYIDVRPMERPWYQAARKHEPGVHAWTAPYTFLTTKEPGMSVSSRWSPRGSDTEYVMAFNITLTEISEYTTSLRPSANGMTVVFTQEGRYCIGLPPDPRFNESKAMLAEVLSPVADLGIPALDAALAAWEASGESEGVFSIDTPDRATWWVGFSAIQLDDEQTLWSAALIPEKDFLGSTVEARNLALAGIGIISMLIAAFVLVTSLRSIRRQMKTAVAQAERRLGQYRLTRRIGTGGNGTVYRAQHTLLRRPTAVKVMNPGFASGEAARRRFEQEVQMTSTLSHPNTIVIFDYGHCQDGTLYYAMELLDGSTLEQLVRHAGALPPGRVIHILQQMAGSLAEAHNKGLIHRDIKPSNAMLCEHGGLFDVVKVVDFGLVKEIEETDGNVTQANVLIGTPLYMAPEIIREPGRASPQSDIYALGAVGYFLLTARHVFEGGSAVEICAKHLNETAVPPSERIGSSVPADLEAIILACLEKDPSRRPTDAMSLHTSLLECRDADTWSQENAREWWQTRAALGATASTQNETPLSNTEFLIDLDHREFSAGVIAGDAGAR